MKLTLNLRFLLGLASALLSATATLAADAPKPVEVKTVHPARGEIIRFVTLPGTIRANQQATLCAKVPGYLKSLMVDKGDHVSAGQPLGEIEVPELAAEAVKYRAEIRVAEADFNRVKAARDKAGDLVTPQAVDEAGGRLEIARANLERIETLLRYSKLTSPFSGVVTSRYVDPGAFIATPTASGSNQSGAIVTLMDFDTVRAQVAVPELEAALVKVGQPARIAVEGLPGKSFSGSLSRLAYALDEATRTMLVEVDLPNPDLALRPGMYATVKVGVEKHADARLLPADAIVMEKANAFAFVVVDGKARKTPLKIGFNDGSKIEVVSGLTGEEAVILAGKQSFSDGQSVRVLEARP